MENKDNAQSTFQEAEIVGIKFGLATHKEICKASVSDCSISHSSQLTNPFLGLPLEFGKCESCGTAEAGKCEGHFGFIELPIPIYHPSHISELKRMLSCLCLKCLKLKNSKFQLKSSGVAERLFSCCEEASQISIREVKKTDGACILQLKLPSRMRLRDGFWNFLERYGFRYGNDITRTLLPYEVKEMLRRIPQDTRKKLARKGYFPQDGYVVQYVPVPPNCLSVPDISDGISVMSSDLSVSMLKKVLKQVEIIKSSRSGEPNFESHEVEVVDLQSAVDQYLQVRGTSKSARDVGERFGVHKESNDSSTKSWLEKMRTLFIRKGSGFSSRSVITGDAYKRVNEIGIPFEIAQRITFEERVNAHNVQYLQELVDNKSCLTYRDGSSTYSLREGSKGHTFLRPGQVVHRRIMDGDMVFINRPPTTHKHSLQALSVYVHDGHTVKINPLICGPLSADFDGDCIHLFYPQSLPAKAEVLELFSVEKQLLSSHSGNLNLQLTSDSLLSLKAIFKEYFLDRAAAQQLSMFVSYFLPQPALRKCHCAGPIWTAMQILQTALPSQFDCIGERYVISNGELVKLDFSRDVVQAIINEVVISIFFEKGPDAVLKFFNSLQPLLMENLFSEGFSVGLEDFYISGAAIEGSHEDFKFISSLLGQLRSTYNELMELQLENHIRHAKMPIAEFIFRSSSIGDLIDCRSDSAMTKVVQQIGFLGLQISDRGKFYTKTLVEDIASHFESKYPSDIDYPSAKHGFIQSCFFHGLDPYEDIVHSVSAREVMVRSTRGLSEPGTLFKNLMAILRDVVICYDGTVRNVCSNSIIQFEYGVKAGIKAQSLFPAGEPVGVLAATAMSNPAYKAVLDSTPSSNSSWEQMKEILQCKVNFKNDVNDRRVILYFNYCGCGRLYCQEKAAYVVKNHLEKVILKDIAVRFMIEYKSQQTIADASLFGHVHLKKMKLQELNISMEAIDQKCKETIASFGKKKKLAHIFRRIEVSVSECCSFECTNEGSGMPCLAFFWRDTTDLHLESVHLFADVICPVLMDTVIKGNHRISSANIIWVSPDTATWIRNPSRTQKGELALDVITEKSAVKQSGDAWRVVLDSCIPVLHMIDTTRSIPYAIKQVQELLGISCAFDQAVQRLSSSVTKVAKGVLKEHLVLLANSMTCAGNLVGFTSGGYKSISHSLHVQAPFTEATLYTPRSCFERAAEKCHVDTLSSAVASCSWGRHVAVGTGSRFDLLWDQKAACLNPEGVIDAYELLNMVRSSAHGGESATACLGADVDDLMSDDDVEDWNLSPEQSSDKPIFEDIDEFKNFLDNGPDRSNGWDTATPWQNANATWGTMKSEAGDVPSLDAQRETSDWDAVASWGRNGEVDELQRPEKAWGRQAKDNSWSDRDNKLADSQLTSGWASSTAKDSQLTSGWASSAAKDGQLTSGWASSAAKDGQLTSGWASSTAKDGQLTSGWASSTAKDRSKNDVDELQRPETACGRQAKCSEETNRNTSTLNSWSDRDSKLAESQLSSGWASSTAKDGSKDEHPSQPVQQVESCVDNTSWEKPRSAEVSHGWGSPKEKAAASPPWGTSDGWGSPKEKAAVSQPRGTSDGWGSPKEKAAVSQPRGTSDGWGSPKEKVAVSQPWGTSDGRVDRSERQQPWGEPKSPEDSNDWGSPKEKGSASQPWGTSKGWGDKNERQQPWGEPKSPQDSHGWGSDEKGRQQQWGKPGGEFKKGRGEGPRGWGSNNTDWKGKNRPAKLQGNAHGDSSMNLMYTVTRQRLDMFTTEEQDILSDVEPLMRSIRRIMHQSGYNDGDSLSAADQTYVIDNVFNYHPDKAVKIGSGIDHVTVDKHSIFQESRCLYVVSTDGCKHDFSYRKCLENFIKGKYPDLAEEFIAKYFKPRQRGNQPQTPIADATQPQTPVAEATEPQTPVLEATQPQTPVAEVTQQIP